MTKVRPDILRFSGARILQWPLEMHPSRQNKQNKNYHMMINSTLMINMLWL